MFDDTGNIINHEKWNIKHKTECNQQTVPFLRSLSMKIFFKLLIVDQMFRFFFINNDNDYDMKSITYFLHWLIITSTIQVRSSDIAQNIQFWHLTVWSYIFVYKLE